MCVRVTTMDCRNRNQNKINPTTRQRKKRTSSSWMAATGTCTRCWNMGKAASAACAWGSRG